MRRLIACTTCLAFLPLFGLSNVPVWANQDIGAKATEKQDGSQFLETIRDMIESGDIRDASGLIDRALEGPETERPTPDEVFLARQGIAAAFFRIQDLHSSFAQLKKLLEYQIITIDDKRTQGRLAATMVTLQNQAVRVQKLDELKSLYAQAAEALESVTDYDVVSPTLAQMTVVRGLQAQMLTRMKQRAAATEMLDAELQKIETLYADHPENEIVIQALARIVGSLMRATPDEDEQIALYEKHQSLVRDKLDEKPGNVAFAVQFLSTATFRLNSLIKDDPEAAAEMVKDLKKRIEDVIDANPQAERPMQQFRQALAVADQRVNAAIQLKTLIGAEAPVFDVESWINSEPLTEDQLRGKVVMLDFWAVWSNPCVKTFPALRKLNDELGEKGLQIIGVTTRFNVRWDEESNGPKQDRESEVSQADENEMIEKFLTKHLLEYPILVMPRETTMRNDFAVTSIPHVVLIDKSGKVRMVKAGATSENLDDIEQMIQKLLEEE